MAFITLLTDFGLSDGFVGVMKGVILGIAPQAQIADISHTIPAQNVNQAAFVLGRSTGFFPPGTVHIAVVDPGVGTQRRPIAARAGDHYLVGPDNGIFTLIFQQAEEQSLPVEVVHLDRPEYWRDEISAVFHGRDIFAPVGAHLAMGVPLTKLGTPIQDAVRIAWPEVQVFANRRCGQIVAIDNFGNLITNIERRHLGSLRITGVDILNEHLSGLVPTFGSRSPGNLVALFGEAQDLTIAVVNGSAQALLHARVGDPVTAWVE